MYYWIHYLFFLVVSIQVFAEEYDELPYSAPEQIIALTQESVKVGGVISPLSGQPCLSQTDLIAKGAQDVILKRFFVSQHRDWYAKQSSLIAKRLKTSPQVVDSGWVIFPHTRLDYLSITKRKQHRDVIQKNEVRIVNPNGVALTFSFDAEGNVQLVDKPYGICNSYSPDETPSGQCMIFEILKLPKPKELS